MSDVLADLLKMLELERIEENLFRGSSQDLGFGAVFGGQVLGQALSAASRTVPENRPVHSFHCYFLRPGDATRPIVYEVEATRDGTSLSSRRIRAVQSGRTILFMGSSFHRDEAGLDHQDPMPEVPGPEELESAVDFARRHSHLIPESMRATFTCHMPIEVRPVQVMDPLQPRPMAARRRVWLRAAGGMPDSPCVHRYLLAYASDFNFLVTALQPHGRMWWEPSLKMASIDHSMWFHRPLRADDWLLYDVDSPSSAAARALVRGRLFSRDGALVASTAQEGLIRLNTAQHRSHRGTVAELSAEAAEPGSA
jgi:acyl-CoA thioesterase-2